MKMKTSTRGKSPRIEGKEITVRIGGELAAVVRAMADRMFVAPEVAGKVLLLQCVNSFSHTTHETDAGEFVDLALGVYGNGNLDANIDPEWVAWLSRRKEVLS